MALADAPYEKPSAMDAVAAHEGFLERKGFLEQKDLPRLCRRLQRACELALLKLDSPFTPTPELSGLSSRFLKSENNRSFWAAAKRLIELECETTGCDYDEARARLASRNLSTEDMLGQLKELDPYWILPMSEQPRAKSWKGQPKAETAQTVARLIIEDFEKLTDLKANLPANGPSEKAPSGLNSLVGELFTILGIKENPRRAVWAALRVRDQQKNPITIQSS